MIEIYTTTRNMFLMGIDGAYYNEPPHSQASLVIHFRDREIVIHEDGNYYILIGGKEVVSCHSPKIVIGTMVKRLTTNKKNNTEALQLIYIHIRETVKV